MELFQYLQSRYPPLTPQNCKIHLASTNEYKENPITEFVNKTFDSWQCLQKHKSFDRTYVVSLIQTEDKERFLYAGTYIKKGCSLTASHYVPGRNETYYLYQLTPVTELDEYRGRMYVRTARPRNFILKGETLAGTMQIVEISPVCLSFGEFPGYKNVVLDRVSLGAIIRQELKSWKTALSIVKGIYLLTDVDGEKLYVGQANGKDGIWGRWKTYFTTGHGGNAGLIEAFGTCDEERLKNVTFSILEIMDNNSDKHEINRREKHWKSILLSRSIGHNRN
ncbi:GIY-YIG nuclease family protein [Salmonella enterica]|nr:GIY-YIG nuclease family protein [Salmonella enterica]EJN9957402.1 GIY-YIG nuclease family protein [Salmonella enterica]EKK2461100.1 GIY-YIG nuclease family protein [Salmonella enterica]HBJ6547026.1 GIY-YIG nuclease family protein [Salmonella enterica subsp. enterica serovar 6,7:-:-]HCH7048640.1 GIY-YIG nuclease family protein [Salmonella enterica subsp. enterica serovar Infantis]